MTTKVTTVEFEALAENAGIAADIAHFDFALSGATQAELTRIVTRRVIEFLIGNDLVEFKKTGDEVFLKFTPPYDGVE